MPVTSLPSEHRLAPKSVLRHRPIGPIAAKSGTQEPLSGPRTFRATHSQTPKQIPARKSAQQPAPVTRSALKPQFATDVPTWKRKNEPRRAPLPLPSRLLLVASGMMLAIVAMLLVEVLIGWIGNEWNTIEYGYPRTYQVDAVVGHQDSVLHPSHFIALNLHGQIEIIEFPGGSVAHARVFVGPQLSGPEAALLPVTLRFVTPPHSHLPDMVVLVGSSQFVFVNAHGTFLSPTVS